jgi:hypothetical protein
MKWIKLYEDFKGSKYKIEDVIRCIENDGVIYSTIITDLPDNDPNEPLTPLSIDDDGKITVDSNGDIYEVDLKDVDKIDYNQK